MKKELSVAFLALALVMSMGSAAAQEENSDVTVNVSEVTQLDVRPSTLSYGTSSDLQPGEAVQNSANNYQHIEITNSGSEEIEEISAEADMHSNQTFGATGLNTGEQFVTGNFVTVDTSTAQGSEYDLSTSALANIDVPHYLNRVEYVDDTPPTYLKTEATGDSVGSLTSTEEPQVGKFRVGGAEYFFVFYQEDQTSTDAGDVWELRIGDTPHTQTQLGTVDFTNSGEDYTTYTPSDATSAPGAGTAYVQGQTLVSFDTTDSGNYTGQSLIDAGGPASSNISEVAGTKVRDYNLYLNFANDQDYENHILRTKVNINPNNPLDDSDYGEVISGSQTPIFQSSTDGNRLQPGQSFPLDIGVQLPLGVAEDRITQGTVTVLASSTA